MLVVFEDCKYVSDYYVKLFAYCLILILLSSFEREKLSKNLNYEPLCILVWDLCNDVEDRRMTHVDKRRGPRGIRFHKS